VEIDLRSRDHTRTARRALQVPADGRVALEIGAEDAP
jgi:hypothetical protein